ncbi:MAG: SDR family oxidoreductase [Polyangiaceae bacterium]
MGIAIVTGANRGIGLELAKQLVARGNEVVAICRHSSSALEALGIRIEANVDLTNGDDIAALRDRLLGQSVDLLINNAGLLRPDGISDVQADAVLEQFATNALGPLRITQALLPLMHPGSKIALVTSRMGSMEDNGSGGYYGYRMSKAALNAFGKSLSLDLAPRQIAVVILHPGFVRTAMTGQNGMIDPDEAARGLLARIDDLELSTTGRFVHMNGDPLPW